MADTAIIRGAGVPTDPDDTAGTKYDKHQAPHRISAPGCLPEGIALCITDTARTVYSVACCMADERQTAWLVFAAAQDSIQIFIVPPSGSYLRMSPRSAAGFVAETARGVDASWIRARLADAGDYVFTVGIESDTPALYELRVAPVIATGASRPIGASATLTVTGAASAGIAIAPASMAHALDTPAISKFAIRPGSYRVLLVRDTTYVACQLPCVDRRSFTMRAGQEVTVTP